MSEQVPVRAAIVGLGRWGQNLVSSVAGQPDTGLEFTRGVTRTPDKAVDFCRSRGLRLSDDYDSVLAEADVDAVVLATPHSQHCDQICAAARAGKHVFVEKPVTLTLEEAQRAIAACDEYSVVLAAGFNRRFLPGYQALKTQMLAGHIGVALHVDANFSGPFGYDYTADMWRGTVSENPAGGMAAMGIHMLDAMIGVLGPVHAVTCLSRRRVLSAPIDDTTTVQIEFDSGATGTLTTLMATGANWRFQVFGSSGWLAMPDQSTLTLQKIGHEPEERHFQAADTLRDELEHFARCIRNGVTPIVSRQDILSGVAAMEAIAISAAMAGARTEVNR
ncbi:Gfo/Idh/MocA family protein [Boseongicola aestuarii]|uniref:4-carboxy-2-hydroxymuconate-6-semialdehyde dehydrogenase n=1 Tax=Boseongicola aestuarii TaxID=1470561 RepID=A0A238J1B7_9RHOB|nr:Gfo/Idh/MocA family oxidoreductase [Boseongicola aestuarii]SMX23694.1 4-carboxy-2-hydroxymuconate-6-semialdehyde dehydrogenase [Boseongicola aestuarii]